MMFGPVIVAVLAFTLLKETLNIYQIIGIALVLIGTYVLELNQKHWKEPFKMIKESKYIHFIFISMLIYGFGTMIDRVMLKQTGNFAINPYTYIGIIQVFVALNFVFLVFLLSDGFSSFKRSFQVTGYWIVLIAVLTVTYRLFQSFAVQTAENVTLVTVIKRSSVFIPVILGGKIFREKQILKKVIATAIMIVGASMIIIL